VRDQVSPDRENVTIPVDETPRVAAPPLKDDPVFAAIPRALDATTAIVVAGHRSSGAARTSRLRRLALDGMIARSES
jgi:hypothetical protein